MGVTLANDIEREQNVSAGAANTLIDIGKKELAFRRVSGCNP